jgi:hypothetical protein
MWKGMMALIVKLDYKLVEIWRLGEFQFDLFYLLIQRGDSLAFHIYHIYDIYEGSVNSFFKISSKYLTRFLPTYT